MNNILGVNNNNIAKTRQLKLIHSRALFFKTTIKTIIENIDINRFVAIYVYWLLYIIPPQAIILSEPKL